MYINNKGKTYNTEAKQYTDILVKCQQDPVWFFKEVLGIEKVWHKMEEIANSVKENRQTVVKAGFGVSKSYTAACIVAWFLNVFKDSIVLTTAPTAVQVQDILWSEIRQIYNNAKLPLGGRVLLTEIRKAEKWFALGISPKLDNKTAGVRFQGFHAPHVLIVFDEAPGISADLYDAAEGLMSGAHCRWLCIGNPISDNDRFINLFKTKGWNGLTISCLESPNVVQNKNVIPGMVTKEWVDEKREQWGEDSALWRTKVLGEAPNETENTLIPLEWLIQSVDKKLPEWKMATPVVSMGIDVARYGSNETCFVILCGKKQIDKISYKGKNISETTGYAIELIKKYEPHVIGIDTVGVGGGLADNLDRKYPVIAYQGGSQADDKLKFYNLNAEAWWNVREDFRLGNLSILNDSETMNQLNRRRYRYDDKDGRLRIETKSEMERRGLDSPDRADAFIIAHWASNNSGIRRDSDDEERRERRSRNIPQKTSRTGY